MNNELLETMNKAPDVVKVQAAYCNQLFHRRVKAEKQLKLWQEEVDNSTQSHISALKEFNSLLTRWAPATNEIGLPVDFADGSK